MKVIIAGSREFNDYNMLCITCDQILKNQDKNQIEIVSGIAKGADLLGEKYANDRNYKLKKFPANWDLYGKSAGYKRNTEMALYADALIAFWDGKSKDTKHMIDLANQHHLKVKISNFKKYSF